MACRKLSISDIDLGDHCWESTPRPKFPYYAEINCVVVGMSEVGKSTLINRIRGGLWGSKVDKTISYEKLKFVVETNRGNIIYNLFDCAGDPLYKHERKFKIYEVRHCAILMYDLSNEGSQKMLGAYLDEIKDSDYLVPKVKGLSKEERRRKARHRRPTIVIGNKKDLMDGKSHDDHCGFAHKHRMSFYALSCKDDSQRTLLYPFLKLARILTKNEYLTFTGHEDSTDSEVETSDSGSYEVVVRKRYRRKNRAKMKARAKAVKEEEKTKETKIAESLDRKAKCKVVFDKNKSKENRKPNSPRGKKTSKPHSNTIMDRVLRSNAEKVFVPPKRKHVYF